MGTAHSDFEHNEQGPWEVVVRRYLVGRHAHYKLAGPEDTPELLQYMQAVLDATMIFSPTVKTKPMPKRLVAKKVLRNTNMRIYGKYAAHRHHIREKREGEIELVEVLTQAMAQEMQQFRAQHFGGKETSRILEPEINEVYLWHGTSYEALRHIFSEDFRVGHKAHMGLFGQGLYFAESCAKADEYSPLAQHEQGWYAGHQHAISEGAHIHAMLLCRVVLGKVKFVQHSGNHTRSFDPVNYDSLIGDREMHRREFILASAVLVFPEFGILYERHMRAPSCDATPNAVAYSRSLETGAQASRASAFSFCPPLLPPLAPRQRSLMGAQTCWFFPSTCCFPSCLRARL